MLKSSWKTRASPYRGRFTHLRENIQKQREVLESCAQMPGKIRMAFSETLWCRGEMLKDPSLKAESWGWGGAKVSVRG